MVLKYSELRTRNSDHRALGAIALSEPSSSGSHAAAGPVSSPIYFNDIEVKRVSDHKHLGLNLDPKLSFTKHISEKIGIARRGIGIKHLAPYLPLKSRDQIFKMHVRPHLDYCDMIYHIPAKIRETSDFDSFRTLNYVMKTLERTHTGCVSSLMRLEGN